MSTQRLCVTVTAPTTAELRRRRDEVADADLIELRLDSVRDPDVEGALKDRRRPVLVTCRPIWEGGMFSGSEEERERLLARALELGAEYVDVEFRAGFDRLIRGSAAQRIVLSAHDFAGMPRDLDARLDRMLATGAGVVKVAVTTARLADCVTLQEASVRHKVDRLVLIGMGQHGLVTRVLPSYFGSSWGYAGTLAGIGQATPATLVGEFRFREIGGSTSLYGVFGSPVAHSVSPAMHNAAFRASGVDAVYLPLPGVDVDDCVAFARAFRLKGSSVTVPYKVAFFNKVDEVSDLAAKVGAINTVRAEGSRSIGDNSDVPGFLEPFPSDLPLTGTRAAVLGAGGAARAVAVALASQGARVTVHARNAERAAKVAALASGTVGPWPPRRGSWDVLINTTPVGMYPHVDETPLAEGALTGRLVYDLVYNPPTTRLLTDAARAGCRTIGGLEMLVGQARRQFEWWTGVAPSAEVMRQAAVARLAEFRATPATADSLGPEVQQR